LDVDRACRFSYVVVERVCRLLMRQRGSCILLLFFITSCYTKNMPEQESIQSLEEELRVLEEKLAARKMEGKEEKEVFRDVLREHIESAKESVEKQIIIEPADSANVPGAPSFNYAAHARQKADDTREQEHHDQVAALVEIALTKGVLAAVQAARHWGNAHLLDDFHDMLIDEYYEKLIQARKIT